MTKEQKIELAKAAPRAVGDLTDSNFWQQVEQHLDANTARAQEQIEPRKLKTKRNH